MEVGFLKVAVLVVNMIVNVDVAAAGGEFVVS